MRILDFVLVLVCFDYIALAQLPTQRDALRDADYSIRRFEELVARVDFSRWQIPKEFLEKELEGVKLARSSAKEAKDILANLDAPREPGPEELLDLISDLEIVGMELSGLSYETLELQDHNTTDMAKVGEAGALAEELARAGNDTSVAEARLLSVAKRRIMLDELQLEKYKTACQTERR